MRTHTQRNLLFRTALALIIALDLLAQATDAAQSPKPKPYAVVSVPQDAILPSQPPQHALSPARGTNVKRPASSLNPGALSFLPALSYSSGGDAVSAVAVADVNRDGIPDLIAANVCSTSTDCSNGSVGVLLGNGDGTFQPAVTYLAAREIDAVAVADVNGDGKPDLVVATPCGNLGCTQGSVGVLLGNGNGTFQAVVNYDSGGEGPQSVLVADVSGDSRADLVVANYDSGTVGVLLGNGDGTFQPAVSYTVGFFLSGVNFVAVGDVNGDGKPDLIGTIVCFVSTNCTNGSVGVLLGNGDGTFQSVVRYPSNGTNANSVAITDVNGDGKPDLLVANFCLNKANCGSGGVSVLLGNGDGSFQAAVTYASGGIGAISLVVGDLNGDGQNDVAVTNRCVDRINCFDNGSVGVLLGRSTGTFQSAVAFGSGGSNPRSLAIADLNRDGMPDLVVANTQSSAVDVLLNNTTEVKSTSTSLVSSLNPSTYGQKVTWTSTVTSSGSTIPTGKVNFTWSGHTIGSATLSSGGVATLTRSNLNADPYPLTAVYTGDAANLGSRSTVVNQVVLETSSTATLTSSPNPSTQGQAVTFTAKISSPTVIATGPVTFTSGKTVLGTAQLSGGKASLTISSLAVGSTKVTVTYYGDSNIAKSSASVVQTVH
jgi:Bacterial Ig-like domain (group 3)/FG-GAP-like repeat